MELTQRTDFKGTVVEFTHSELLSEIKRLRKISSRTKSLEIYSWFILKNI